MATEMAVLGVFTFRSWLSAAHEEDRRTFNLAYLSWLRDGGLGVLGEQYGLVVETLLLLLTDPRTNELGFEASPDPDPGAWDYMTEAGFRLEVYEYARRSTMTSRAVARTPLRIRDRSSL